MAYQAIPPAFNALDTNQWIYNNTTFMKGLIPQLTKFTYQKLGPNSPPGTTTANDGVVEGAGKVFANATATFLSASIYQTCKTKQFAFTFRGKFAVPVAARNALAGLTNAGGSHDLAFGWIFATDATKYILVADGTTSTSDTTTLVVDTNPHDYTVTGDITNLRFYVDRVLYVTRAIGTNVVDEPYIPFCSNTISGDETQFDFLYGYIAP